MVCVCQQRGGEGESGRIASGFRREASEVRGRHGAAGRPKGLSKAPCYPCVGGASTLAKTVRHPGKAPAPSLQPDASTLCGQLSSACLSQPAPISS